MKPLKFTVNPEHMEKGSDGIHRATFDVYEGGTSHAIADALAKKTGEQWFPLGAYMDIACVGTRTPPTTTITIEI